MSCLRCKPTVSVANNEYCEECEVRPYNAFWNDDAGQTAIRVEEMKRDGWLHMSGSAGMVKRCASCSKSPPGSQAIVEAHERIFEKAEKEFATWYAAHSGSCAT